MSLSSRWLELRCGRCHLLLPADCVEEVGFAGADTGDDHREWRGRLLPVRDFCVLLGLGGPARQQVVVARDGQSCIVAVDEVVGLRQVAAADWQPLSAVSAEAARHFDAVLATADGSLLRLREPFAFL